MKHLVIVLIIFLKIWFLCACTDDDSGEDNAPYKKVSQWSIDPGNSYDFSGGIALAATSQFVFAAKIAVGHNEITMYDVDGQKIKDLHTSFNTAPDQPIALAFYSGFLYVSDKNNRRFVRIDPVHPGSGETELLTSTSYLAFALDVDSSGLYIHWFSGSGDVVRKYNHSLVLQASQTYTVTDDSPYAIAADSTNNLYLAMGNRGEIEKLTTDLNYSTSFTAGEALTNPPLDIAIDGDDTLFVIHDTRVVMYDTSGNQLGSFGSFISPLGLAVSGDDVYIADWNNGDEVICHYVKK